MDQAKYAVKCKFSGAAAFSAQAGGSGAGYRIRTRGPLITNQVLYQLS